MTNFVSKLSSTRAGDRTRIWLQGPRLAEAGFTVNKRFTRKWTAKTLTLELCSEKQFDELGVKERGRVSGKGELPIIDITGLLVAETFTGTHVSVTYADGIIIIRNA